MEAYAVMEIACMHLVLSEFNLNQMLKFVQKDAVEMVNAIMQQDSAIVMKDLAEVIAVLRDALVVVMNQMENASMELASAHQITVALIVLERTALITALVMEDAILNHIHAIVNQDGLAMIVV